MRTSDPCHLGWQVKGLRPPDRSEFSLSSTSTATRRQGAAEPIRRGAVFLIDPKEIAMAKLNQIIAVQAGKKSQAKETLTEAYHKLKKPDLLSGIVRTYQPKDEDGEPLPEERKQIQLKVN